MKLIYLTCKDEKEARKISGILVKEKLAACVNFFPINSVFSWEGKIDENKEIGMFVKTKDELVDAVTKKVKELHSYDVPCIICLDVKKGNKDFFDWVEKETR